ncbi:MAG: hypothetical protein TR69_WS6001000875 [candidate division WS6 bacterium OLB20]|uniref:Uncharacterized protein n=1 Tax=candidate division WS6 bacterium OLB20 TaxID=1617426 RepID=A0A136LYV4_9BACT|nr:MAG: hypothetical protein TR69_WS6001000875 [candidate division WS6 bacterium OLB20]
METEHTAAKHTKTAILVLVLLIGFACGVSAGYVGGRSSVDTQPVSTPGDTATPPDKPRGADNSDTGTDQGDSEDASPSPVSDRPMDPDRPEPVDASFGTSAGISFNFKMNKLQSFDAQPNTITIRGENQGDPFYTDAYNVQLHAGDVDSARTGILGQYTQQDTETVRVGDRDYTATQYRSAEGGPDFKTQWDLLFIELADDVYVTINEKTEWGNIEGEGYPVSQPTKRDRDMGRELLRTLSLSRN